MKIVIPNYRAGSRNRTTYTHWGKYTVLRNEMAAFIRSYAHDIHTISPARVVIEAYYAKARGIDTSNIDDKMIIDGLMHAGILRDDTPAENPEVVKRSYAGTGKNELIITIEKLNTK